MADNKETTGLPEKIAKPATEVRRTWSDSVNEAATGERQIVIEKNGTPVAALISAADLERYRRLDAQRRERFKAIEEVSRRFADVPEDELEREIDRAVAEVRKERRARRKQMVTSA